MTLKYGRLKAVGYTG